MNNQINLNKVLVIIQMKIKIKSLNKKKSKQENHIQNRSFFHYQIPHIHVYFINNKQPVIICLL